MFDVEEPRRTQQAPKQEASKCLACLLINTPLGLVIQNSPYAVATGLVIVTANGNSPIFTFLSFFFPVGYTSHSFRYGSTLQIFSVLLCFSFVTH